jgi:hypothetical protein
MEESVSIAADLTTREACITLDVSTSSEVCAKAKLVSLVCKAGQRLEN